MTEKQKPSSTVIRQQFLDFFASKGHCIVPSAPLVPLDDPTLLFTNAGMNQFKDIFLGLREPEDRRVADSQKCMRVSGKHNDLDDVGRSPFHHTLFEMLGNWSFGDYYKREAISWAWELLTRVWGLPEDDLWVTVFEDEKGVLGRDEEAAGYWRSETSVNPGHIVYFGSKDNFWEMGDTGPCGPCSEIHLDMGPEACNKQGVPGHVCGVNGDCRRFIELWNLVFIQYNRLKDGHLEDLPARHVDTGMGFERAVTVLQGVESNYDTDLFKPIIDRTQALLGHSDAQREAMRVSYRVIADHVRAITFLIGDGVLPSNEGRGYVLRLILRRAARHGRMLGFDQPFLAEVAKVVIEQMGTHYDELVRRQEFILSTIDQEEARFAQTLSVGLSLLDELIAGLKARGEDTIPGADVFRLYDTYGFPLDLTHDVARDHDMTVDLEGYQAAMMAQQERARSSAQFGTAEVANAQVYLDILHKMKADGAVPGSGVLHVCYEVMERDTTVAGLIRSGEQVERARQGDWVEVVLPATPFYVESGGQVADTGVIVRHEEGMTAPLWEIRVDDVRQPIPGLIVHSGQVVRGDPVVDDPARAVVDLARRWDIMRNHTATHLLDTELRNLLGEHVHQAGSVVAPDRLRFDFTHPAMLSKEQLAVLEQTINERILAAHAVEPVRMRYRDAIAEGAIALFTEKYGDEVRVIRIGNGGELISKELCGGTHVNNTAQIGLFHIVSEESVGAGVRRIEAVTGRGAQRFVQERLQVLESVSARLHVQPDQLERTVSDLQTELHDAQKELGRLRGELARQQTGRLLEDVVRVGETPVLAAQVADVDLQTLRDMSDWLRDRLGSAVVVLATAVDGKPQMIAAVTDDLVRRGVHAGALLKVVAKAVGGGGGGKPGLAQAGGRDLSQLPQALALVPGLVEEQLSKAA